MGNFDKCIGKAEKICLDDDCRTAVKDISSHVKRKPELKVATDRATSLAQKCNASGELNALETCLQGAKAKCRDDVCRNFVDGISVDKKKAHTKKRNPFLPAFKKYQKRCAGKKVC